MRNSPPRIVVYGRTIADAYDLICDRRLSNCEPCDIPWLGLWISDNTDLTVFGLRFAEVLEFQGNLAIVPPGLVTEVENFIQQVSMGGRVQRHDLTAVRFWDTDDEEVFTEAWG